MKVLDLFSSVSMIFKNRKFEGKVILVVVLDYDKDTGVFDDLILSDLVSEGYGGDELLSLFKEARKKVRPGVVKIIEDAEQVAQGKGKGSTFKEVFGEDL